jgi:hypothetical protein
VSRKQTVSIPNLEEVKISWRLKHVQTLFEYVIHTFIIVKTRSSNAVPADTHKNMTTSIKLHESWSRVGPQHESRMSMCTLGMFIIGGAKNIFYFAALVTVVDHK